MTSEENKVTLKEYLLALLAEHEKRHELIAKALEEATDELEEKQKTSNEWRATVGDFRDKTISRVEFDEYKDNITIHFQNLEKSKAKLDGGLAVIVFIIAAVASLIVKLIVK